MLGSVGMGGGHLGFGSGEKRRLDVRPPAEAMVSCPAYLMTVESGGSKSNLKSFPEQPWSRNRTSPSLPRGLSNL